MRFIDRQRALDVIEDFWNSDDGLLIIYGRRRVGKSRLIKEFTKRLPEGSFLYFLASRRSIKHNVDRFSNVLAEKLGIRMPKFDSFTHVFEFLADVCGNKKFLVIIDEFTYLVERDEGVLSDFQEIVDEVLARTKIKIILSGSLVGMMESRVLGYRSPLYGRSRRVIKLPPLRFRYLIDWYGHRRYADLFKIYSVTNGVPKYLEFFTGENVLLEIKKNFFDNTSFLFRDALELLKEELRDPTNYILILEAMANGLTKLSEISNYTYMEPTKITSYISTLRNLGIVKRMTPIFAPKKARKGIYVISDLYYLFWFRFVSQYYEEIENETPQNAIRDFEKNFDTYLGTAFENYARQSIIQSLAKKGFNISRIGKWWSKNIDIDIVAVDDEKKTVIFGEIKWSKLTIKDAYRILAKLEEKAKVFPHKKNYRKKYCIVAREFKEHIEEAILIDLEQLVGNISEVRINSGHKKILKNSNT